MDSNQGPADQRLETNRADRERLRPLVVEKLRTGWTAPDLVRRLTLNLPSVIGYAAALLEKRLAALPDAPPAAARRGSRERRPWCGKCAPKPFKPRTARDRMVDLGLIALIGVPALLALVGVLAIANWLGFFG